MVSITFQNLYGQHSVSISTISENYEWWSNKDINMSLYELPPHIDGKYDQLLQQYPDG